MGCVVWERGGGVLVRGKGLGKGCEGGWGRHL